MRKSSARSPEKSKSVSLEKFRDDERDGRVEYSCKVDCEECSTGVLAVSRFERCAVERL